MKTTATTAMETLLALPPLSTIVQAKAFATADRLAHNGLWMKNFSTGHGKIGEMISDPIFKMPRDRMKAEVSFMRRYETIRPSRDEWWEGRLSCLPEDGWVGFTDGYKTLNFELFL